MHSFECGLCIICSESAPRDSLSLRVKGVRIGEPSKHGGGEARSGEASGCLIQRLLVNNPTPLLRSHRGKLRRLLPSLARAQAPSLLSTMAPSLDKLKKRKSKDTISAKAAEPAPAPAPPAEIAKVDSKRCKRKSQTGEETTPSASTSAQAAVETEPPAKKSKKTVDAEPTEPPAAAEKATKKKRKDKKGIVSNAKIIDEDAQGSAKLKETDEEKAASVESKDKKPKEKRKGKNTVGEEQRKEKEGQATEQAGAEIAKAEKTVKAKKGKAAVVEKDEDQATPSEGAAEDKPKSSKKVSKDATTLPGISHPTLTSKSKDKKKRKAPSPEPEPSASDKEVEMAPVAENDAEGVEEDEHLYGFSTDDNDSSDEEMDGDWGGIDVGKLPTIAKDDVVVKKKLEKAKKYPVRASLIQRSIPTCLFVLQTGDRGVIYLGRIPHGFYEDQMRQYFAQFGTVTRLRLSRNKKVGKSLIAALCLLIVTCFQTGRAKHYAFIEFDSSSVAEIVADTMDNYLLMGHILTCKVIPKDEIHPELWIGANRKWRVIPRDRIARVQHNKVRPDLHLAFW